MGQYEYMPLKWFSLIECMVDHMAYERQINACRFTFPLAPTVNEPPHSPFSKGERGRYGGGGGLKGIMVFKVFMDLIKGNNKPYRGYAPNTMSTFSRKKYQKLAPAKSPGVPLCRDSLRFFNSAPWASDTKNLLTLVPPRCTEIFLMGQYRKYTQGPVAPATGKALSL
jgi:hypothetical protein